MALKTSNNFLCNRQVGRVTERRRTQIKVTSRRVLILSNADYKSVTGISEMGDCLPDRSVISCLHVRIPFLARFTVHA